MSLMVCLGVTKTAVQPTPQQESEKIRGPKVIAIGQAHVCPSTAEYATANLVNNDTLATAKLFP
jgi:hypothetical protein